MNYRATSIVSLLMFAFTSSINAGYSMGKNQKDASTVNIIAFMKPKKGKADELRKALLSLVRPTHSEKGCIVYDVYQTKDSTVFLYEVWQSQQDLDTHLQKPYIKDFVNKIPDLLDGKNDAHFGKLISKIKNKTNKAPNVETAVYISSFKHPKQGKADELRNAMLALVEPTHSEKGCIAYNIYQEQDGTIFLYEVWQSQQDLEQHFEKSYIKNFMSKVNDWADMNTVYFGKLILEE